MTLEIRMKHCQQTLLEELHQPGTTRRSIALTMAWAIRSREALDWPTVNRAIVKRWSRSGLEWIKREAWKQISASGVRQ